MLAVRTCRRLQRGAHGTLLELSKRNATPPSVRAGNAGVNPRAELATWQADVAQARRRHRPMWGPCQGMAVSRVLERSPTMAPSAARHFITTAR